MMPRVRLFGGLGQISDPCEKFESFYNFKRNMRRLKAHERRQQLIEVATRLFARNGFDATTTASIAEAAGVSEPILYRHFKNKQELFVAIVREMSRKTLDHWNELIANEKRPDQQLRIIALEFPEHMRHLEDAYHVLHNALSNSRDRTVIAVLREHYSQIHAFFMQIVVSGQKQGLFRKDILAVTAAWHLVHGGIGFAMVHLNIDGAYADFDVAHSVELSLKSLMP